MTARGEGGCFQGIRGAGTSSCTSSQVVERHVVDARWSSAAAHRERQTNSHVMWWIARQHHRTDSGPCGDAHIPSTRTLSNDPEKTMVTSGVASPARPARYDPRLQ